MVALKGVSLLGISGDSQCQEWENIAVLQEFYPKLAL